MTAPENNFLTNYKQILDLIDAIDPVAYAANRNYADGSVSRLSPYISRGVISTKFFLDRLLARGYSCPIHKQSYLIVAITTETHASGKYNFSLSVI